MANIKVVHRFKWLSIVCASLMIVASLTMVILSILRLSGNGGGDHPLLVFQIIVGVMLMLVGLISGLLSLTSSPEKFDIGDAVTCGLFIGIGIFIVLPQAASVLDIAIGYLVPSILIGVGAFVTLKAIVDLAKKLIDHKLNVIYLIFGVVILILGIVLLIFADKMLTVMWLILGVALLIYSIIDLVKAIKA